MFFLITRIKQLKSIFHLWRKKKKKKTQKYYYYVLTQPLHHGQYVIQGQFLSRLQLV